MPSTYNSKTINDNDKKFCGVGYMTSSLRYNDVITVKVLRFSKNLANQGRNVSDENDCGVFFQRKFNVQTSH